LVDDSSKSNRVSEHGRSRPASSSSERSDFMPTDPGAVLKLFDERLKLDGVAAAARASGPPSEAPVPSSRRPQVASFDALDLTPMPATIEQAIEEVRGRRGPGDCASERLRSTPPEPLSCRRIAATWNGEASAEHLSDAALAAAERTTQRALSYHPPRHPPGSQAPPPPETSISVAKEYDPRAPTKPRVRRSSTVPPPPALFGLDRMLVWGMVLGGLFVAAVIVLVNKLAPSSGNAAAHAGVAIAGEQTVHVPPSAFPSATPDPVIPKSTGGTSGPPAASTAIRPRRAPLRDVPTRRGVAGPKGAPSVAPVPELWIE
jgi:hypothetical protein